MSKDVSLNVLKLNYFYIKVKNYFIILHKIIFSYKIFLLYMKKLIIRWQRLVQNNSTCPRCADTELEIEKAYVRLKQALKHFDIEVLLEKYELTETEFNKNPLISNLILINGKPLEAWLGAETGRSKCCSVCGDEECRTIQFKGNIYEVIPENLIIKACLIAASEMIPIGKNRSIFIIKNFK